MGSMFSVSSLSRLHPLLLRPWPTSNRRPLTAHTTTLYAVVWSIGMCACVWCDMRACV